MVIHEDLANDFIREYMAFLSSVAPSVKDDKSHIEKLIEARSLYISERSLFSKYQSNLLPEKLRSDIASAIEGVFVDQWIYLKDTRWYSILVSTDGKKAIGVRGLNDRVRDMVSQSGTLIDVGVFCIQGIYVVDGLITQNATIGKNYKSHYNECYKELKSNGEFSIGEHV